MANIRRVLEGEGVERMAPWYKNFKGHITEEIVKGETRYNIQGLFNVVDDTTLEVHELPLRSWWGRYNLATHHHPSTST